MSQLKCGHIIDVVNPTEAQAKAFILSEFEEAVVANTF